MHGLRDFCDKHFSHKCSVYELDDWVYTKETAEEKLLSRFSTASLKGFGVDDMHYAVIAAGSILVYLEMTGHTNLSHITTLRRIDESAYVRLDRFTMRNLELIEPLAKDGKSLLSVIDRTTTPMGSRMLRWWLAFPEISLDEINRRLDVNEFFFNNREFRDQVFGILNHMGDMERLAGRLGNWKITPREMWQLGEALMRSSALKKLLASSGHKQLSALADRIPHLEETATMIADTIVQPQSGVGRNDYIIAAGVDPKLDELKNLSDNSTQALQAIQQREIEATGISSLKIGFNNVFGYYLEVRNTHKDKVPPTWIRRQTLTSAERYITEELKEYEGKILGAKEKIQEMEDRIFKELIGSLLPRLGDIHAATRLWPA